jgi:serine/threonine protein kinase
MIHTNKMRAAHIGTVLPGAEENNRTAFAREISILESLRHPNICQLKETFFDKVNISKSAFSPLPLL